MPDPSMRAKSIRPRSAAGPLPWASASKSLPCSSSDNARIGGVPQSARRINRAGLNRVYAMPLSHRLRKVEAKTETFDQIVLNQDQRLDRWAKLISGRSTRMRETYAYANNHYAGFAPETIRELTRRVAGD